MISKLIMLLVGSLLFVQFAGEAEAIEVSQSIDHHEIAFEDSAQFQIKIEWDGGQSAYRFEQALDPFFDRLKVKSFSSSIDSHPGDGGGKTVKTYNYTLIPTSSGAGKIDPITIKYLAMPDSVEGELVTEPVTITIAEPVPVKVDGDNHYLWVLGVAIVLLGAVGGAAYWRKRTSTPREPKLSPVEEFLSELTRTKSEAGSDLKKFQVGLHAALAGFFSNQYGINVEGLSDEGVAEALDGTSLAEQHKQQLANWFVTARRDKFRPVTGAPGDVVRLENEIRSVFDKMK